MASFPGAVKSFASRSNGQSIDASHVNDLQDEITALEDGYLNGTARLNSSNSTVTNLSVSGGSTLAAVSVTSPTVVISTQTYVFPSSRAEAGDVLTVASTSGSTATLQWRAPTLTASPRVRLTHDANQNVANGTVTGLNWNTELYDSHEMHSTASNSSRITFADSTGVYHLGASVYFNANATGSRQAALVLNDASTGAIVGQLIGGLPGGVRIPLAVSADVHVTSTSDYVTVVVYQDSGSTTSVGASAQSKLEATAFWAHRVSS